MRLAKPSLALACFTLLCACSVSRLEDVPSAQAIDARAGKVKDLVEPPDMAMATVEAAATLYTSDLPSFETVAALYAPPPPRADAKWTVRYRDGGFDAENAEGGICSGRSDMAAESLSRSRPVELACNDGQFARLVVESYRGSDAMASLNFGTSSDTAIIVSAQ